MMQNSTVKVLNGESFRCGDKAQQRECQDILDRLLREHKLWLDSGGAEGSRLILKNADLSDLLVPAGKFDRAIFEQCRLDGFSAAYASFAGSDFTTCVFRAAHLREADFSQAEFHKVQFVSSSLGGATFKGATFDYGTSFESSALYDVDFTGAEFRLANIKKVQYVLNSPVRAFRGVCVEGADLSGLTVDGYSRVEGLTALGLWKQDVIGLPLSSAK